MPYHQPLTWVPGSVNSSSLSRWTGIVAQERLAPTSCISLVNHRPSGSTPLRLANALERHQRVSATANLCLHAHGLLLTAVDSFPI
jgi:hypothetical protein